MTAGCGLEQVSFFENKAGLNGGAICSMNSPLSIISCTFKMNEAGCSSTRKLTELAGKMIITTPIFMARGGGAIFFVADEYQAGFKNAEIDKKASTRTLYTDCCCFAGNSATSATDFESSPGHDIMLDGYVSWTSFGDALIVNNHNSIGSSSRGSARAPIISKFDLKNISAVESCGDNIKIPDIAKTSMTFQSPGRIIATSETSNVPKPTEYIYRATPITELPYATTKSWTKNSTA